MAAGLALVTLAAGCAGSGAEKGPPVERKVKVDATNIVPAQKAGYKVVNQDGKTLYCRRDLNVGSHVRKTTSCLTEAEWQEMMDTSRRGVEAMSRERAPRQGN
jgi:hypothetical protein